MLKLAERVSQDICPSVIEEDGSNLLPELAKNFSACIGVCS